MGEKLLKTAEDIQYNMSPYKNPEDAKARSRRYYKEHRDEKISYQKQYTKQNKAKKSTYDKEYRRKNRERLRNYHRHKSLEWYRKNRLRILQRHKAYQAINKERIEAQKLARQNVPLSSACEICGSAENLEHHHPDYSEPFKTITVCRSCHVKLHLQKD